MQHAEFCKAVDWVLRGDAFGVGEQSAGDMALLSQFLPCVLVAWLAEGGAAGAPRSVRELEEHLYGKWLVSALGGPSQADMLDAGARARLLRFPEELRLNTGLVSTSLPGEALLG